MHKLLSIIVFLACLTSAHAQVVSNVRQSQHGDVIWIEYSIDQEANVQLYYSVDDSPFVWVNTNYTYGTGHVYAGEHTITWRVLEQYDSFVHDNVRFKVVAEKIDKNIAHQLSRTKLFYDDKFNPSPDKHRFYLLANFSYSPQPQYAGGFMLGTVKKFGWYFKLNLSFTPTHWTSSKCDNDLGIMSDGLSGAYIPDYTGKDQRFEMIMSAGFVARLVVPIYVYTGLGYGSRQYYWETSGSSYNRWICMQNQSYRGVAVDAGLMYDIWHFRLKTGVTTINFKYLEYDFGLGWVF